MHYNITHVIFTPLSIEGRKWSHFIWLMFKRIPTFGVRVVLGRLCSQLFLITKPDDWCENEPEAWALDNAWWALILLKTK